MEDEKIVELYWARSETAISESDAKYGKLCHYVAMNILADEQDAEECVNDTWLGAWNSMPPQRPQRLSAYLARLTRNISLNRYTYERAQKRVPRTETVLLEMAECLPDPAEPDPDDALRSALERFLATLNAETRVIFVRRYWYVSPVADIARDTGRTQNSVKVILSRTRLKLKEFLAKEGISL